MKTAKKLIAAAVTAILIISLFGCNKQLTSIKYPDLQIGGDAGGISGGKLSFSIGSNIDISGGNWALNQINVYSIRYLTPEEIKTKLEEYISEVLANNGYQPEDYICVEGESEGEYWAEFGIGDEAGRIEISLANFRGSKGRTNVELDFPIFMGGPVVDDSVYVEEYTFTKEESVEIARAYLERCEFNLEGYEQVGFIWSSKGASDGDITSEITTGCEVWFRKVIDGKEVCGFDDIEVAVNCYGTASRITWHTPFAEYEVFAEEPLVTAANAVKRIPRNTGSSAIDTDEMPLEYDDVEITDSELIYWCDLEPGEVGEQAYVQPVWLLSGKYLDEAGEPTEYSFSAYVPALPGVEISG